MKQPTYIDLGALKCEAIRAANNSCNQNMKISALTILALIDYIQSAGVSKISDDIVVASDLVEGPKDAH